MYLDRERVARERAGELAGALAFALMAAFPKRD